MEGIYKCIINKNDLHIILSKQDLDWVELRDKFPQLLSHIFYVRSSHEYSNYICLSFPHLFQDKIRKRVSKKPVDKLVTHYIYQISYLLTPDIMIEI